MAIPHLYIWPGGGGSLDTGSIWLPVCACIGCTLLQVFSALEGNKERLAISEYALSQSTLEQVFLRFAKLQDIET